MSEDFRNGDHIGLSGWRLSVTAARAAGLVALLVPVPDANLYDTEI